MILILSLGSVSASDLLTGDSGSVDGPDGLLKINNDVLNVDNNIIKAESEFDGTTFSELSSKISNSFDGDTIILTNNISQDGDCEIVIDKAIILLGNGNVIDAEHASRIFNITSDNVVLKDIIFYNGNWTGFGGAIHWSGDNGIMEDCSFYNNAILEDENTDAYGGAVAWYGKNGVMNHCIFFNNTAETSAGAVRWSAENGFINNSIFISNYGLNAAGALYLNRAQNTWINGCEFRNNKGYTVAGGLYVRNSPNVKLTNCTIVNNSASINNGGSVYWANSADYIISDCNFTNNTAEINGGALYSTNSPRGLITNCNFDSNRVLSGSGGALNWNGPNSNLTNCNFTNNKASDSGAVDTLNPNGRISNCNFINNSVTSGAGVISWGGENGLISDCNFINCTAAGSAGAVYWLSNNKNGTIINCNFTNIKGKWGGAIRWDYSADGKVINCNFINNTAADLGGALYWRTSNTGEISNCSFINCKSENNGGSIYVRDANSFILSDCIFINSFSNNGGGALMFSGQNIQLLKCNFTNTSSNSTSSGVIDWGGSSGDIRYCNVENSSINVSLNIDGYYPDAVATLEANNFDGLIHIVDGGILSQTYLDVMTNADRILLNGEILLNATLWDDNGNRIYNEKKLTYAISNGETVVTSDNDWTANYTFNQTGTYLITASLPNIKNVTVNEATVVVYIYNTTISAVFDAEDRQVIVTLVNNETDSPLKGAFTTIKLAGKTFKVRIDSAGQGVLSIDEINPGSYVAVVSYKGSTYYAPSNTTVDVAFKGYANITVVYDAEADEIVISLINNVTGSPLKGAVVLVNLKGESYRVAIDATGLGKLSLEGISPCAGVASIIYKGGSKYYPVNATLDIDSRYTANITVSYDDETKEFIVYLVDSVTGQPLKGSSVTVKLAGQTYYVSIDATGQGKISISYLLPGDYDAKITYKGSSKYQPANKTVNNIIVKGNVSISAVYDDGAKELVVSLINDVTGQPLKGASVTVKLAGQTYKVSIDATGQGKISTADIKLGSYVVAVSYKGNDLYNPANTTANISLMGNANISAVYNGESKEIVVTLVNNVTGDPLKGAVVIVNINGSNNKVSIDSTGQGKLSVADLAPGSYDASVTYKGGTKYYPADTSLEVIVNYD